MVWEMQEVTPLWENASFKVPGGQLFFENKASHCGQKGHLIWKIKLSALRLHLRYTKAPFHKKKASQSPAPWEG